MNKEEVNEMQTKKSDKPHKTKSTEKSDEPYKLKSTFKWGNYCVNEEIELEKAPKLIREKEKCYD
jgi:hypothetical protein